ncbi:MAG: outer membrane beta-barrel protein [bacterium]
MAPTMKSVCLYIGNLLLLVAVTMQRGEAQYSSDRWALETRFGPSVWFNDANQRKTGVGGELELRYGVRRWLSVGFTLGYNVLKSGQTWKRAELPEAYLKIIAWSFSLASRGYFLPGRDFNPYVYCGLGAMVYRRLDGLDNYVPDGKTNSSVHIPLGVGAEFYTTRSISFDVSAGLTVLNDLTDRFKSGSADSYLCARAGVNFYFGVSGDDDDDGDGLTNAEEWRLGTNLTNPDTDEDGLSDGDEVKKYHTDPLRIDTDGGGIPDGNEVDRGTNPLDPTDDFVKPKHDDK